MAIHSEANPSATHPPESLKTDLCIGRRKLQYERCQTHNVPFQKVENIVAAHQHRYDPIGGFTPESTSPDPPIFH